MLLRNLIWLHIFSIARVTHSRILNRVHMVSNPYRAGSTLTDLHRDRCQFLRIPWATIRQRKSFGHVQKFLQGIQLCINIRIDSVRTALTRFNPKRKNASTLVVYCMTFIVMIQIRSEWKQAELVPCNNPLWKKYALWKHFLKVR
jgi:hypothetical protein